MFYKVKLKSTVRVPPELFNLNKENAVFEVLKKELEGFINKDFGFVIDVAAINEVGEGVVIPGDGAAYFDTIFEVFTFKPELQEVVLCKVKDITDFGAFMNLGAYDGMVHISQTMDDYVSFSKDKVLLGRDSKKSLKINDKCRARIIAVSYKDITEPKIGLTMRQQRLGKLEWLEEKNKKEK